MNWIMIAIVSGSLLVSGHDTREQCEGRAVIVRETTKSPAKCVEAPGRTGVTIWGGGIASPATTLEMR